MPNRVQVNYVHCGDYLYFPTDGVDPKQQIQSAVNDSLIWSDGHYGYPDFPPDSNIGGAFRTSYWRTENGSCDVGTIQGGTVYSEHGYRGSVYTDSSWGSGPPSWIDPSNMGATAYDRMKPDKPSMNGLNAIYELKDVPYMLQQRFHAQNLSEIGDYYLALKFGWEALFKDVVSFVVTHRKAQQTLKQLLRDEGKPVRRKIQLSDSSNETYSASGGGNYLFPSFVSYFYADGGSYRNNSVTRHRQWASAQFRYWLPSGPRDVEWTNAILRKIFGFKATPAVVYRAIPWTWLAEWFTNLGDMIDNLETSLVDRLAADYFYVMDNVENLVESTCNSTYFQKDTLELVKASATGRIALGCKTRLPGDPFGWGTPENSLNGVQLSIMGALGLSRLR